jgi:hypothetical protein
VVPGWYRLLGGGDRWGGGVSKVPKLWGGGLCLRRPPDGTRTRVSRTGRLQLCPAPSVLSSRRPTSRRARPLLPQAMIHDRRAAGAGTLQGHGGVLGKARTLLGRDAGCGLAGNGFDLRLISILWPLSAARSLWHLRQFFANALPGDQEQPGSAKPGRRCRPNGRRDDLRPITVTVEGEHHDDEADRHENPRDGVEMQHDLPRRPV